MRTRSRPIAAGRCFLVTVGVLVLFTIARQLGWLGPPVVSESILIALLVVVAVSTHATLADLGLARSDARAGVLYGAVALAAVALILVLAAVIPATNGFLHDSRAQISGGRLLYELGVEVILLTAIPKELAGRSRPATDLPAAPASPPP